MSRVIDRCHQLAQVSDYEAAISRVFLSPKYLEGLQRVQHWMQAAGLSVRFDPTGNLWGKRAGTTADAPTLIIGSHLDTVPNAGAFDGILGVMVGLEVVERLNENGIKLPFHLEIVGLGDEEGVVFPASMLGSKAVIGSWNEDTLELCDAQGNTLRDRLIEAGFDAEAYGDSNRREDDLLGYWEVHMEQGPVLENDHLPVGVVSAIAGARRFKVNIEGKAGHAGTVPMLMRQDALAAAAELIRIIEQQARQNHIVATVGRIQNYPNAVNVIPNQVEITLDIRSDDDALRERIMNLIFVHCQGIEMERQVDIYWHEYHYAPAAHCAPHFRTLFEQAISEQNIHIKTLVSGAGHDAMIFAEITDVAMLFVRCRDGVSHHPDEYVSAEDAEIAVETLYQALLKLADQYKREPRKTL